MGDDMGDDMGDEVGAEGDRGTTRRRFLQAAAAAGAVGAVWAEPIIRGAPAYAQSATSVNGDCNGALITWSGSAGTWLCGMATNANVACTELQDTTFTWDNMAMDMVCMTLTSPVTLMSTGTATMATATVAITSGASCMLSMVAFSNATAMLTSGPTLAGDGYSFTFRDDDAQTTAFTFDIVC